MKNDPPKQEDSLGTISQGLPETPSGLIAAMLGNLPKPIMIVIILLLLGIAAYVAYHYFMPKEEEAKQTEQITPGPTFEKVYVSGRIHINNGEPRPNEIKRMTLRDMDSNPARFTSSGQFTFDNVKIPEHKKLLVDVTFADGTIVSTEEIRVGDVDVQTKTARLPDLYIERPKASTDTGKLKPDSGAAKKPATRNHFESHDESKQINNPDNQGTINIDQ